MINCCFIREGTEGSMKFWNGQVMPVNFNNTERNNFNAHCKQKKSYHEK